MSRVHGRFSSCVVSLTDHCLTVGERPIQRTLVSKLSIALGQGERWALVGRNGSGKSTLSQLLTRSAFDADTDELDKQAAYVSFDSHRQLRRDEALTFRESRFGVEHKRATVASYLFPSLHKDIDPEGGTSAARTADGYKGYAPPRTRLSPLPLPYDATGEHPLLAELEHAACTGEASRLLERFGLHEARHRPLYVLSTGQLRKAQLAACLLTPPKLMLLDEALDGLDASSRRVAIEQIVKANEDFEATLVMVAHRREDLPQTPTHALLLGLGPDGSGWRAGEWPSLEAIVDDHFDKGVQADGAAGGECSTPRLQPARTPPPLPTARVAASAATEEDGGERAPLIEFDEVSIQYDCGARCFVPPLDWTVREGENWAVVGGNGAGKTTLIDLVSGDNVLGYRQKIRLFGRPKGSGESVWDVKRQLGVISTQTHMEYVDHAEAVMSGVARSSKQITTWEVVVSGFFDSIGLYAEPSPAQLQLAKQWVECFGLGDLVAPPKLEPRAASRSATSGYSAAAAKAKALLSNHSGTSSGGGAAARNFCHLSFGQQKLVLLCRAVVKQPRLLLLDEPTHGLSSENRQRLLGMLATLAADPSVSIVLVTHRQDEIDQLGFEHFLRLHAQE